MLYCALKISSFYAILLTIICDHVQEGKNRCYVMRLADIVEIIAQER